VQNFVLQLFWLLMAVFLVVVCVVIVGVIVACIAGIWMFVRDVRNGPKGDS
jgi:uncharacterized membrane protein